MTGAMVVTGGAGFIGSHLVEELVRGGHRVVVVDDLSTGVPTNLDAVAGSVEIVSLDLCRGDLTQLLSDIPADTIFHLAGQTGIELSLASPRSDMESNLGTTLALLEAARTAAPESKLIHVSSAIVYGDARARPFREDDPTAPSSPYAVSKLAAEHYVSVFARLLGLRAAVVRPFTAYGPRQRKQVVYDLIRRIDEDQNELHVRGDGTEERSFTFVSSIVDALVCVADRGELAGEAYNVVDDNAASIAELVGMLCELMNVAPRVVYEGTSRPGDVLRLSGDTTRLRSLGWEPRVDLRDGLEETVAWFRREPRR